MLKIQRGTAGLARDAELITDPDLLAERLRHSTVCVNLTPTVVEMAEYFQHDDRPFRFRPSHLLRLHRIALDGISSYAGNFRPAGIEIGGSRHHRRDTSVPRVGRGPVRTRQCWLEDLLAVHLAGYILWRLNWIHPFTDGNGRTSRAASYLVMCCKLGYVLPGKHTIPDQISENKTPYYEALEAADESLRNGELSLAKIEEMLSMMLGRQLYNVHVDATQRH